MSPMLCRIPLIDMPPGELFQSRWVLSFSCPLSNLRAPARKVSGEKSHLFSAVFLAESLICDNA